MKITLNMVLECLSDYYCENHMGLNAKTSFSRLRLYDPEFCRFDADTLYVCTLSAAIGNFAEHPDTSYVCLRDRFRLDDETEELMRNKIVVTENIELTHLYSRLKLFFDSAAEWSADMWSAAAKGASMEAVLNMSRGIIGNSINVTDSSMRLIASTDTETDDKITLRLRKYGYHTDESRDSFRKAGCYDEWNTRQSVYTSIIPEMSPYLMVNRIFKFREVYFLQVVMVCDHKPFSPGLLDLFNMLLEVLETYIDKQRSDIIKLDSTAERIISDLIDNDPDKRDSLRSRLYDAGVPYIGSYRIIAAAPDRQSPTSLDGAKTAISTLFPEAFSAIYHGQIVALIREAESDSADWEERLDVVLEKHSCQCGISMSFSSMEEFSDEYAHASAALRFSGAYSRTAALPDLRINPKAPRVWLWESLSMLYSLSERLKGTAAWQDSPFWKTVKSIYDADIARGTNNAELLYCFLRCERSSKAASELLHMHRNNVAYRIGRLCESTGLDLSEPETRINLYLALIMLKTMSDGEA